jgi:hypothetical protein
LRPLNLFRNRLFFCGAGGINSIRSISGTLGKTNVRNYDGK